MLHLHDIESGYGAGQVLFGVSLSVPAGRVVSLMGRNGMGKTTTIRTIMGQLPLTAGRISRFGNDQPDQLPFQIARLGLGLVPEGRQIFSNLDVTENLKTFYRPPRDGGGSHWHYERVLDLFPRLAERRDHAGNHLSGGEQQMLAIGRALMTNPKLLILDEATEGLAPIIRTQIWDCLATLKAEGQSILIIDKNVKAIARLADHHYILDKGRVVWNGDSKTLLATKGLTERYLGV
ncbi:ABC transporter ATP-binding protein [Alphaproteobacteria bacterium]|jgi:branched-chain amino acid transport system ATP-binding protein|nr:ABC transporter ATP-binding protein [Alphaproteobacteria bacterium]MDC1407699.1 ABC transporter ATP-binding protein [Candidatus Puniceispirillum sp.]MDA9985718.1 ABC transporter ATP-binding protein [Alphaproteobacteria bacterium]MDB2531246.1 ABC transporter ATP-binding protein [Alphaproteobacteria bacterium]MDB4857595.1 ABC transporter ATP-binding protein [Alphaproteobacteria bacterium]